MTAKKVWLPHRQTPVKVASAPTGWLAMQHCSNCNGNCTSTTKKMLAVYKLKLFKTILITEDIFILTWYCGWLNFRGVPIYVVFVEGLIHKFQYTWNSDFLYELWSKTLWPRILKHMNVSFYFNPRKLVTTKIKPSTVHFVWLLFQGPINFL